MNRTWQQLGLVGVYVGIGVVIAHAAPLGAGTESDVMAFFDKTTTFLIKTVGAGVFVIGLAITGIKMSAGDQDAARKATMVTIGGAITFLAPTVLNILKGFTPVR